MTKEARRVAEAFKAGRRLTIKRTATDGNYVWLHGNTIAYRGEHGEVYVTLAGWGSPTTRDRLNAICDAYGRGRPFSQKRFVQYFDGREISADDKIPLLGPLGALVMEAERRLAA